MEIRLREIEVLGLKSHLNISWKNKVLNKLRKLFKKKPPTVIDRTAELRSLFPDFDDQTIQLIKFVEPFTMTSPERISTIADAVDYITANRIAGDIVECGVWRGGSMMAAARSLIERSSTERSIYLFDTFEGMPPASDIDRDFCDVGAQQQLAEQDKHDPNSIWCYASLSDVQQNMAQTQYPESRIQIVKGKVEETLHGNDAEGHGAIELPKDIAILRLDTDWYESTKVCLEELFPRLVDGGVLIIDDYGHWKGCRKAVDEYFSERGLSIFLQRIDYTGRIAIKPVQQTAAQNRCSPATDLQRFSA